MKGVFDMNTPKPDESTAQGDVGLEVFLEDLSSTPAHVGELDLDGGSQTDPVCTIVPAPDPGRVDETRRQEQEIAGRMASFREWLERRQQVAPHAAARMSELTEQAADNPAAARLKTTEGTALATPLPVSQVSEAVLETGLELRLARLDRGRDWLCRFADLAIIRSPLPPGSSAEEHRTAVLSQRYGSADAPLGDAIFAAGAFPEVSQVLISEFTQRLDLTDRDVVFQCPYFLRNRADRDPHEKLFAEITSDPDVTSPQDDLAGVIVTSLGWGGAANVGAQLARWWSWGFTSAVQANLAGLREPYSFGDWNDDPRADLRQSELARQLVTQSHDLIEALPAVSQRIIALDHPVGAITALHDLVAEPMDDPLALVVITMDPRRIRFVARHMLSEGGRYADVRRTDVEATAQQLLGIQEDLVDAMTAHRDAMHVVQVELHDHLDDGYTDSTEAVDPVDADFDSFCETAVEVSEKLLSQVDARRATGAFRG